MAHQECMGSFQLLFLFSWTYFGKIGPRNNLICAVFHCTVLNSQLIKFYVAVQQKSIIRLLLSLHCQTSRLWPHIVTAPTLTMTCMAIKKKHKLNLTWWHLLTGHSNFRCIASEAPWCKIKAGAAVKLCAQQFYKHPSHTHFHFIVNKATQNCSQCQRTEIKCHIPAFPLYQPTPIYSSNISNLTK